MEIGVDPAAEGESSPVKMAEQYFDKINKQKKEERGERKRRPRSKRSVLPPPRAKGSTH